MSHASRGSYQHAALPGGRTIRLIQVHAASVPESDLACNLDIVNLDDKPEYAALSYAWEGQTPLEPIFCTTGSHQGVLLITPNCAAAMRQLRRESGHYSIWIDSICIDQSSIDERNSQVALMGDIYKAATQVVVWLGQGDECVWAAMDLLRKLAAGYTDINASNGTGAKGAQLRAAFHARARQLTSNVTNDEQDMLHPLFQLAWFTRMWTVQEIALNFKGVLNCGGVTLPWTDLIVAVDVLGATGYQFGGWKRALQLSKYLAVSLIIENLPGSKEVINKNSAASGFASYDNNFDVLRTFFYAREKQSSDPKDKIFALYAVLRELRVKLPPPDYRKTLSEIYAEATMTLIEHDQNLVVLHYVTSANRRNDIPSWVPDFTDKGFDDVDPRFPVAQARFKASGQLDAKWETRADGLQLLVRGKILDKVMYRGQRMPLVDMRGVDICKVVYIDASGQLAATDTFRSLQRAIEAFKEWCDVSQWSGPYPNDQTTKDALRATLLNDFPRSLNDANCMAAFEPWFQFMTRPDDGGNAAQVGPARIAAEFKSFTECFSGPGLSFHAVAMPFCGKKTFFRTEQGWFGTAPEFIPDSVQAGDVIASIRGMAMPVVLRPSTDGVGYQLISHCYVHGFMYGKAWNDRSAYKETGVLLV